MNTAQQTKPRTGSESCNAMDGGMFVREACGSYRAATPGELLGAAEAHLLAQIRTAPLFDSPTAVKDYLRCKIGTLEHEVFGIMLLDSQNRLIDVVELFRGTTSQTSVYPREVVKTALLANCSAILCYHNHPSGLPQPSRADEALTQSLKAALALIDVRVLDHLVVTAGAIASFAEMGLL